MARDPGLEELVAEELADVRGLAEKPMFGGLAWLLHGHLLCGARDDGLLLRLGKGNDAWALALPGVARMISSGRAMAGWVRVPPAVFGDDALRRRLFEAALAFVRNLPPK